MQLATNSEFETRLRAKIRGVNDRIDRLELLRIKFDDLTNSVAPRARRSRRAHLILGEKFCIGYLVYLLKLISSGSAVN